MQIPGQRRIDHYFGYLLVGIFLLPTRLLGIILARNHQLSKSPRNVLFIKILGLGSLLLAEEAIREIRKKFPGARLILLTDKNIGEGMVSFELFDEIWTIRSMRFFLTCRDALKYLFKSWSLKQLWIVDLEVYSKLTTVYALLTFAINRFGFFLSPVFFRKYLNTHNIFFDRQRYLEDNYLAMAKALTRVEAGKTIQSRRRNVDVERRYIALNNTCSDLAWVRKLPEKTFAEICIWILDHTGYSLALLGAPGDKQTIDQFILDNSRLNEAKSRVLNYAGLTDFAAYYKFLSDECICLISIDSAPVHIAKKLGVPTVSIWGPTNPANYLKLSGEEKNIHLVHYDHVHCSPCIHYFEKLPCHGNNFCMKDIQAFPIIEKIKSILEHGDLLTSHF